MITAFTIWWEYQARPSDYWAGVYIGTLIVDLTGIVATYDIIRLIIGA